MKSYFIFLILPTFPVRGPILILALCCAGIFNSSCTTSYYAPSLHSVPLLNQANELHASGSGTLYPRSQSTDIQVAFSPKNKLGLMLNTSFFRMMEDDSTQHKFGLRGDFIEGAVGYYDDMGNGFVFDTYLGYGYLANGMSKNFSNDHTASFNYNRIFLQPAIGYKDEIFDMAFSCRFSYLNYHNLKQDSIPPRNSPFIYRQYLYGSNFVLMEPALTFRLGYRYVKFQGQFGTAINLSSQQFAHDRFSFSFGVVVNLRPNYMGSSPFRL